MATETAIVDVPDPGAEIVAGVKPTVRPVVGLVAGDVAVNVPDSAIDELNPPETAVVIVDFPLEPRATESELGEALTEKPVVTVKVTVAVCVMPPPAPVTVIV